MRTIRYLLLGVFMLISLSALAGSNSTMFFHDTPQGVVRGDKVRVEVMLNTPGAEIYDISLFYRETGKSEYTQVLMENEGFLYQASINTENITSGRLEYFIGYEGRLGKIGTLPEISAQTNPYVMLVAPAVVAAQKNMVEIVVVSPEPDETVPPDELVIAAYLMGVESNFDLSRSKLLIDGTNVTSMIDFADGVLTFSPKQIRGGTHNIEINLMDAQNNLIGKKEWSFKAGGGVETRTASNYRGSVFIENRYQDVSEISDNFFRGGGEFSGRFSNLDASARLLFSSEETPERQPVNRYGVNLRYNLSSYNNIYLRGGDFTPIYNPLTFYNKRVRGIQTGLQLGFFLFDFVYGQSQRGINGNRELVPFDTLANDDVLIDTLDQGGIYQENIIAFRPGFRFGKHATWSLNLLNAKEDPKSIKYGGNAKESLVVGTDLSMNFDDRRIIIDAAVQASIANTNAGGAEVTWDTLTSINSELKDNSTAESMFKLLESTGFLSMTEGLSPLPSLGMNFEATLRYFKNDLQLKYASVAKNFATPGNPYMLKDINGIYINDNLRIMNDQLFLNLFYNNFQQDKSNNKLSTSNQEIGATVSYFPVGNIPSFTVGYANINRSNDVSLDDTTDFTNPEYYMEDNSTQRFMFSTTYNLEFSRVKNALSLTMNTYGRDEGVEFKKNNTSDFTLYGIGLVSRFPIALITRLNYSQSASVFGSTSKFETNIQRIFLGAEYELLNLMGSDQLRPFVNVTIQNIENKDINQTFDTPRNNYSFGLSYRNLQLGVFSLRFDQISYQIMSVNNSKKDLSDTIFNVRYQYNF